MHFWNATGEKSCSGYGLFTRRKTQVSFTGSNDGNCEGNKFGFQEFGIFLLLDERNKEFQKELIKSLKNHSNCLKIIEYSGQWDLEVSFLAKNIYEFDKIISDFISKYSNIIIEKSLSLF